MSKLFENRRVLVWLKEKYWIREVKCDGGMIDVTREYRVMRVRIPLYNYYWFFLDTMALS